MGKKDESYDGGRGQFTGAETLDPSLVAMEKVSQALGLNTESTYALKIPLHMLGKALVGLGQDAIQMQKSSLAFNKNFNDIIKTNSGKIEGLPGGLKTSLESVMAFQHEGLFNVSRETLNLANTMHITGQSMQALVGINKKLATLGTMSRSQLTNLNKTILENSLTYGVTAETLIGSINNLNEGLTVLGFTGGAAGTTKALTELTSKFPALGDRMGDLTEEILKGDTAQLARLGIFEDVNRLISGGVNSDEELKRIFEKINKAQAGFAPGAKGIVGQRARMEFAGPIGIMAKQVVDGMKEFQRDPQAERQSKIFENFNTAMATLFMPLAAEVGLLTTKIANMITASARWVNEIIPLKEIARALVSVLTATLVMNRLNLAKKAIAGAATLGMMGRVSLGLRGLGALLGGPWGIALGVGIFALTSMLGKTSDAVDTLAQAEADRAKAELSQLRSDSGATRFEGLTRVLINSQAAQFETLNAARTNDMVSHTQEVVSAIDRTTGAVDDTVPPPIFRVGHF